MAGTVYNTRRYDSYHHEDLETTLERRLTLSERNVNEGTLRLSRRNRDYMPDSDEYGMSKEHHITVLVTCCTSCGNSKERETRLLRETDREAIKEVIRRTNKEAERLNRRLGVGAVHGTLHPKMHTNGCYPRDFEFAMSIDRFESLSDNAIDRILVDYDLHERHPSAHRHPQPEILRRKKLARLYEFLGAVNHVCADNYDRGSNDVYTCW